MVVKETERTVVYYVLYLYNTHDACIIRICIFVLYYVLYVFLFSVRRSGSAVGRNGGRPTPTDLWPVVRDGDGRLLQNLDDPERETEGGASRAR